MALELLTLRDLHDVFKRDREKWLRSPLTREALEGEVGEYAVSINVLRLNSRLELLDRAFENALFSGGVITKHFLQVLHVSGEVALALSGVGALSLFDGIAPVLFGRLQFLLVLLLYSGARPSVTHLLAALSCELEFGLLGGDLVFVLSAAHDVSLVRSEKRGVTIF